MASLTISDGFNFFIKSAPKNIDRVEVLVESEKYRLIDDAMTRYIPKRKHTNLVHLKMKQKKMKMKLLYS